MTAPRLTIRSIRAVGVEVPMSFPLGTSAATLRSAPLLLIDLETEEGITGHAYLFCYVPAAAVAIAALLGEVLSTVKGEPVAPVDLWTKLARRFTLIGVQGTVRMAMAGFDVACWDALAIAAGKPLVALLGGAPHAIPAYNSNGLGLMAPEAAADEAEKLLAGGFRAVKLRLGYPTLEADLAAVRAVRERLPDHVALMTDYNQALSVAEAIRRGRALDGEGIYWIEEPIRHDDYRGCARLARELATPVQIGENFSQPHAMEQALIAGASDFVMPDLERIGGVTGWMRAASLAAAHGIEMSSHLFPEVSAHLLAATPTCHWLEYVDWASAILAEPMRIENGNAVISDRPGTGVAWNEDAVKRYRMK
ncbi:MAG TPA: enolase C-terminal domain-like protein [Burkholderiaceae bacterium]|jgi:mandelate racemase|nr:enolase C-terminal domain-like protein [Burkholderiaceae bacterium]